MHFGKTKMCFFSKTFVVVVLHFFSELTIRMHNHIRRITNKTNGKPGLLYKVIMELRLACKKRSVVSAEYVLVPKQLTLSNN